jgi:hypothetical protein
MKLPQRELFSWNKGKREEKGVKKRRERGGKVENKSTSRG